MVINRHLNTRLNDKTNVFTFIYLGKSVMNKFLFTMTAYPGQTRTTLGQVYHALWDSHSQPDVIQPGFEPGTVVTPLALRCSALDRCATQEPNSYFRIGITGMIIATVLMWYISHGDVW